MVCYTACEQVQDCRPDPARKLSDAVEVSARRWSLPAEHIASQQTAPSCVHFMLYKPKWLQPCVELLIRFSNFRANSRTILKCTLKNLMGGYGPDYFG